MKNAKTGLIVLLTLIFIAILLRTAWVADDAYLTMRTVDNFAHGYGLTWNTDERVQAYTHPLWMFLLTGAYLITHDAYWAALGLSLLFSALTMTVFLAGLPGDEAGLLLGWAILLLSNAFIDYSTSGLENAGSHLIAIAFVLLYLQEQQPFSDRRIFLLSLLAGLAAFNRMDTFLLFAPALVFVFLGRRSLRTAGLILAGLAPFIFWEMFSLIYYGFFLPNTYFAKLNTGIAEPLLLSHGLIYFLNSVLRDPLTLIVIGWALFFAFTGDKKDRILAAGIAAYLGYVAWIGGDFMSGRFFSIPLLLSAYLLIRRLQAAGLAYRAIALTLVIGLGLLAPVPSFSQPPQSTLTTSFGGVDDEQAWYYPYTGLANWGPRHPLPDRDQEWVAMGRELQESGQRIFVGPATGFLGFYAGPQVHIIDRFALGDALLARLPVPPDRSWRIGHFKRYLPLGYEATLAKGENNIKDPSLAEYYTYLNEIIRGPIWAANRWNAIWKMNTGQYEYLIRNYLDNQ
jgi:arabinofuranosyltransferase